MKHLVRSIVCLLALGFASATFAQESDPKVIFPPPDPDMFKWDTFGNGDDQFHARFPKLPAVFLTYRDLNETSGSRTARIYSSYEEGMACMVIVFDNGKQPPALDQFIGEIKSRFFSSWDMSYSNDLTVNTDNGKYFTLKKRAATGGASFFVKQKRSFMFAAVGVAKADKDVKRFLESITMWASALDKAKWPSRDEVAVAGLSATGPDADNTKPKKEPIKPEDELIPGIRKIRINASDATPAPPDPSPNDGDVFESDAVTTKALVVLRPDAAYTEEARNNGIDGVVQMTAVFGRDGNVTHITVIQGLPYGLTESAMAALRHLVFIPATKDDHYVSQRITIDYEFSLK